MLNFKTFSFSNRLVPFFVSLAVIFSPSLYAQKNISTSPSVEASVENFSRNSLRPVIAAADKKHQGHYKYEQLMLMGFYSLDVRMGLAKAARAASVYERGGGVGPKNVADFLTHSSRSRSELRAEMNVGTAALGNKSEPHKPGFGVLKLYDGREIDLEAQDFDEGLITELLDQIFFGMLGDRDYYLVEFYVARLIAESRSVVDGFHGRLAKTDRELAAFLKRLFFRDRLPIVRNSEKSLDEDAADLLDFLKGKKVNKISGVIFHDRGDDYPFLDSDDGLSRLKTLLQDSEDARHPLYEIEISETDKSVSAFAMSTAWSFLQQEEALRGGPTPEVLSDRIQRRALFHLAQVLLRNGWLIDINDSVTGIDGLDKYELDKTRFNIGGLSEEGFKRKRQIAFDIIADRSRRLAERDWAKNQGTVRHLSRKEYAQLIRWAHELGMDLSSVQSNLEKSRDSTEEDDLSGRSEVRVGSLELPTPMTEQDFKSVSVPDLEKFQAAVSYWWGGVSSWFVERQNYFSGILTDDFKEFEEQFDANELLGSDEGREDEFGFSVSNGSEYRILSYVLYLVRKGIIEDKRSEEIANEIKPLLAEAGNRFQKNWEKSDDGDGGAAVGEGAHETLLYLAAHAEALVKVLTVKYKQWRDLVRLEIERRLRKGEYMLVLAEGATWPEGKALTVAELERVLSGLGIGGVREGLSLVNNQIDVFLSQGNVSDSLALRVAQTAVLGRASNGKRAVFEIWYDPSNQELSKAISIRSQRSELRLQQTPLPITKAKVLIDFKDLSANFSAGQIKEVLFIAGKDNKNGGIVTVLLYNVDFSDPLGKFFRTLKLPNLQLESSSLGIASKALKNFNGEVVHLFSEKHHGEMTTLSEILGKSGIGLDRQYLLAYRNQEGGTLGIGLRDIRSGDLKWRVDAGTLAQQLPDYMDSAEGMVFVISPELAGMGEWQALYESSIAFSRAA